MAIFDELKSVGKVLQEAGKIEQYQQILEVQEKLLVQQKRIFDLEHENGELKSELKLQSELVFEKNAYWIMKDNKKDGPFCTKCKDSEEKMIRMREGDYMSGWAYCPGCKQVTP
ncbi:MAG: hypothetical protein AUK19_02840 [Candidatus Moranbacteria bacterium CG2_30_45_14]|nr:MAG: hypothetical protein AUK19_02840 [Candidatus Moranbacteria bacterium CG2_30_45_14]